VSNVQKGIGADKEKEERADKWRRGGREDEEDIRERESTFSSSLRKRFVLMFFSQ
jgi:hypothetical protein